MDLKTVNAFLSKQDPVLKGIIASVDYPQLIPTGNVFHDLMSLIIEQQIHYRSSKKIFQKLLDQAAISELSPKNFHLLEETGFGNARLSEKKFQTMNEVIDLFSSTTIDWSQLSNDEVRSTLKKIKGIGDKTIDALLIFSLDREDVFIYDDYHIQKIIPQLYDLTPSTKLLSNIKELSEQWSPYKSYAFRYLLAWKEQLKKK